jgi:hypothetical protein
MIETEKGRFMEEITLHFAVFGKQGFVDKILTRAYWRELEQFDFDVFREALRRCSIGASEPVNAVAIASQCRTVKKSQDVSRKTEELARGRVPESRQLEERDPREMSQKMRHFYDLAKTYARNNPPRCTCSEREWCKLCVTNQKTGETFWRFFWEAFTDTQGDAGACFAVDPRFRSPATVREAIAEAGRR